MAVSNCPICSGTASVRTTYRQIGSNPPAEIYSYVRCDVEPPCRGVDAHELSEDAVIAWEKLVTTTNQLPLGDRQPATIFTAKRGVDGLPEPQLAQAAEELMQAEVLDGKDFGK